MISSYSTAFKDLIKSKVKVKLSECPLSSETATALLSHMTPAACADCCANTSKVIKTSLMCFEAERGWILHKINIGSDIIQQVRTNNVGQQDQKSLLSFHLPENNVSSSVSFPCLDQCVVSRDGFFHDVMPAIELLYLCTTATHSSNMQHCQIWPKSKSVQISFIYEAQNHNHIASVGFTFCPVNNTLCP